MSGSTEPATPLPRHAHQAGHFLPVIGMDLRADGPALQQASPYIRSADR